MAKFALPEEYNTTNNTTTNTTVVNDFGHVQYVSPEAETIEAKTEESKVKEQIVIEEEHWIKCYWRPAMGWLYMIINFFDFVVFPIVYHPWQSLTLSNNGMLHIAFGAIVGVTAWSRGQEKIAKM
jgi:hypothetical protein